MAKQNNLGIWVIVMILIVLFLPKYGLFFVITGAEEVKRDYQSIVDAGATINVKYEVYGASGEWGVSIMDKLSCPGYSEISKKIVMISTEGTVKTAQYQIPNKEGLTCTFSGDYQFGDKSIRNFMSQSILTRITTPVCQSGADTNNDGVISRTELGFYINKWINNQITRTKLGQAIMEWVDGC